MFGENKKYGRKIIKKSLYKNGYRYKKVRFNTKPFKNKDDRLTRLNTIAKLVNVYKAKKDY